MPQKRTPEIVGKLQQTWYYGGMQTAPSTRIVRTLMDWQQAEGLTTTAFAEKLGVDKATWSVLTTALAEGTTPKVGAKIMHGAWAAYGWQAFPLVLDYISDPRHRELHRRKVAA